MMSFLTHNKTVDTQYTYAIKVFFLQDEKTIGYKGGIFKDAKMTDYVNFSRVNWKLHDLAATDSLVSFLITSGPSIITSFQVLLLTTGSTLFFLTFQ